MAFAIVSHPWRRSCSTLGIFIEYLRKFCSRFIPSLLFQVTHSFFSRLPTDSELLALPTVIKFYGFFMHNFLWRDDPVPHWRWLASWHYCACSIDQSESAAMRDDHYPIQTMNWAAQPTWKCQYIGAASLERYSTAWSSLPYLRGYLVFQDRNTMGERWRSC